MIITMLRDGVTTVTTKAAETVTTTVTAEATDVVTAI